jgi:hypothetical protein
VLLKIPAAQYLKVVCTDIITVIRPLADEFDEVW